MSSEVGNVAIIGVGLVGASLGAAIKKSGFASRVSGVGRNRANLEIALEKGCVDRIGNDVADMVADADLVVLATPVDAFDSLLAVIAEAAPSEAIVSDVGSVKRCVCKAAAEAGLARRFLGGHPMAGGVSSGAEYASADLFVGRVVALTPTGESSPRAHETVTSMWRSVGGEVLLLDAAEHDHVVAASSHLPQMVSIALAASCARHDRPELFARLAAGGLASVTRTAASDPTMWRAIVAANCDEIATAMDGFGEMWKRLRESIGKGDLDAVQSIMEAAAAFKGSMRR